MVVEPTHLKNYIVKLDHETPIFGMKTKNISNHPVIHVGVSKNDHFPYPWRIQQDDCIFTDPWMADFYKLLW